MIPFILKYWKFGIGALLGALIMFGVSEARVWLLNASHEREMAKARQEIVAECEADKKLTEEVSHDYQTQIAALNRRLADFKRVRRDVCVPVTDTASRRDDGAGAGHASGDGLSAGTLYDYAGKAEQYRLQLVACQSFIRRTWAQKKDPQ